MTDEQRRAWQAWLDQQQIDPRKAYVAGGHALEAWLREAFLYGWSSKK